jgi:hypothetical protein
MMLEFEEERILHWQFADEETKIFEANTIHKVSIRDQQSKDIQWSKTNVQHFNETSSEHTDDVVERTM